MNQTTLKSPPRTRNRTWPPTQEAHPRVQSQSQPPPTLQNNSSAAFRSRCFPKFFYSSITTVHPQIVVCSVQTSIFRTSLNLQILLHPILSLTIYLLKSLAGRPDSSPTLDFADHTLQVQVHRIPPPSVFEYLWMPTARCIH